MEHCSWDFFARIMAFAARESISPLAFLLAALKRVISDWSKQDDIVMMAGLSLRTRPELMGMAGLFSDQYPVRSRSGSERPRRVIVEEIQAELISHCRADAPRMGMMARKIQGAPPFRIALSFDLPPPLPPLFSRESFFQLRTMGLSFSPQIIGRKLIVSNGGRLNDINLSIQPHAANVAIALEYDPRKILECHASKLAAEYLQELRLSIEDLGA